jgi:cobalt/nickel transport system permease protein
LTRIKFLDKTLLTIAHAAEQSLFSETYARKRGFLQALDVRVKLFSFLCLLVLISFLHAPETLWIAYGLSLGLAISSRVPIGFFLKRVWLFVPLFSAAIVLPALLNIVTPGDPVLVLVKLHRSHTWGPYTVPSEIAVTRQGLWGGILFVSRVAASVSFAVLFTLTSKWNELFSGLRSLFVPRIFVITLSITERYLYVLLRLIQDMYRARKSRTIRPFAPSVERGWTASRIGVTFKKSVDMSEDIYKAMLSRGFHGEFPALNRFRITAADIIWMIMVPIIGYALILMERNFLQI